MHVPDRLGTPGDAQRNAHPRHQFTDGPLRSAARAGWFAAKGEYGWAEACRKRALEREYEYRRELQMRFGERLDDKPANPAAWTMYQRHDRWNGYTCRPITVRGAVVALTRKWWWNAQRVWWRLLRNPYARLR